VSTVWCTPASWPCCHQVISVGRLMTKRGMRSLSRVCRWRRAVTTVWCTPRRPSSPMSPSTPTTTTGDRWDAHASRRGGTVVLLRIIIMGRSIIPTTIIITTVIITMILTTIMLQPSRPPYATPRALTPLLGAGAGWPCASRLWHAGAPRSSSMTPSACARPSPTTSQRSRG
jgi:hypothetical protein